MRISGRFWNAQGRITGATRNLLRASESGIESRVKSFDRFLSKIELRESLSSSSSGRAKTKTMATEFVRDDFVGDDERVVRFFDVGANLVSESIKENQFNGYYNHADERYHERDLESVLMRARECGVREIMVTTGTLKEAKEAIRQCREWNDRNNSKSNDVDIYPKMYATCGVHPTRCNEFENNCEGLSAVEYFESLRRTIEDNRDVVKAIGECGLDYDRLHFCDKETQKKYFELQFSLAIEFELPMFLHSRNSREDFYEILKRNSNSIEKRGCVVHSFTGSLDECNELLTVSDFVFIGINGCSLKTEENVRVAKEIPLEKLLLETDAPWCVPKHTHFGLQQLLLKSKNENNENMNRIEKKYGQPANKKKWEANKLVKDRCEPAQIVTICEIVAVQRPNDADDSSSAFEVVAKACYANAKKLFFP